MRKGFTLIELMIVIAIIAIIAAIAIPSLLRSAISGNETSAVQTLKDIQSVEAVIRKQDNDGNNRADYWVYDVFGMAAMVNPATPGLPFQAMLDIGVAQSDHRLYLGGWAAPAGGPDYGIAMNSSAKTGYYVDALNSFDQTGDGAADGDYPQTYNAANTTLIGNNNDYGFIAIPAVYDKSGLNIFICSGGISIYQVNAGGPDSPSVDVETDDADQYDQGGAWDMYPGPDPTAQEAPSGNNWRKSE